MFDWEVYRVSHLTWYGPLSLLDHGLDGLNYAGVRVTDFVGLWSVD